MTTASVDIENQASSKCEPVQKCLSFSLVRSQLARLEFANLLLLPPSSSFEVPLAPILCRCHTL